jgi:hypothetical protein
MANVSLPNINPVKKHSRYVHGANSTVEYAAYSRANHRCRNPENAAYVHYGGRGIEFRFQSFSEFANEMGPRPSSKHSLDRIDVNGHYEAGNVRWATASEQQRNRTNNRLLTMDGVTKCLTEWSEISGILPDTLHQRLKSGWCDPCAISRPAGDGTCPHHFSSYWDTRLALQITRDVLETEYVQKRRTDAQIAADFGCRFQNISRLRKKFGIRTIRGVRQHAAPKEGSE